MELEDRIRSIQKLILDKKTARADKTWHKGLPELLEGQLNRNLYGESILVEKELEPDVQEVFQKPLEYKGETVARLAHDINLAGFDIEKAAFLDTETTGLAGGTGTYAFLVGLGFLKNGLFKIKQYFMRDFHEEKALLFSLHKDLEKFEYVVSYNGKRYDIPLLKTRFIVNRIDFQFENLVQLDLLYPTRRVWKRRLGNCSLSNIESCILNVYRKSDVPSEMVPQIYFDFIQLGETQLLKRIFDHNAYDIASMVSLLRALCICFDRPQVEKTLDPVDLFSLGRFHLFSGEISKSITFFDLASKGPLEHELKLEMRRLSSLAHKKLGHWLEAEQIWLNLLKEHPGSFFSYEELAKYYEHQIKDYTKALHFVNSAIRQIDFESELDSGFETRPLRDSFCHRKRRLERKLKASVEP